MNAMASDGGDNNEFSGSILDDFAKCLDRNIYGLRYVSYGFGALGLIILARNVRLTKKFTVVADIPQRFIEKHVFLQGNVQKISLDGVLSVQHTPILTTRWSQQSYAALPVTLTATDLLPSGVKWLQSHLQNQQVWFRLMTVTSTSQVSAIVIWKKNWYRKAVNVNQHLIHYGLATFKYEEQLLGDQTYEHLATVLNKAEVTAERKGRGVWQRPTWKEKFMTYREEVKDIVNKKIEIKRSWVEKLYSKFRGKTSG